MWDLQIQSSLRLFNAETRNEIILSRRGAQKTFRSNAKHLSTRTSWRSVRTIPRLTHPMSSSHFRSS